MAEEKNRIVTLTTDFGYQDSYVGTMKGVMLGIRGDLQIVDLTHAITPFSVLEASFVLQGAYSFFPERTLHVAVVDPGVGSVRRIIYLEKSGQRFLAPDNGLLTHFFDDADTILSVEESEFLPDRSSRTFHGRDIFAPLAARLCAGLDPAEVGPALSDPVTVSWPEPTMGGDAIEGCVIYVDVFGNLVTNITAELLAELGPSPRVHVKGEVVGEPRQYYEEMNRGEPLALINSFGLLEIALRERNAARHFDAGTGDEVIVQRENAAAS